MAKITPKNLVQMILTTEIRTGYTVPRGKQAIIKEFVLCNTSDEPVRVFLHLVKPGQQVSRANAFVYDMELRDHETKAFDLTTILDTGSWTIQAYADRSDVATLNASGVEVFVQA